MSDTFVYEVGDSLYINLTNRCSNACSFCIRNSETGIDGYDLWLTHEPDARKVIAQIKDPDKYKEVVFCGYGEPMIRLDVMLEIAQWLKERNVKVRVNTNGHANLIHGYDVTPALEGKVDVISISLNAPDARSYQEMCNSSFGESAYDAVIDFARRCKEYVPEVILSVVDVIDEEAVEKCRLVAKEAGVGFKVRRMVK